MNTARSIASLLLIASLAAAWCAAPRPASADDRIQPYAKNPSYWQYKGKPVLLLGGSVEDNLFQIPDLVAQLDLLKSVGGNYVRCTMSARDEGNVWPFAKAGDRYDLDRFNDEYWRRFERFLAETARRQIIVQIELWATFDYYRDIWARNPFNPRNNVNYTAEESGLPLVVNSHPIRTENDFFRSVPEAKNLAVVLKYQRRFVEKLLGHSLKYDHVFYCMDNETSVTPKWGAYWATLIRQTAAAAGKQAETTEMWDKWDLADRQHDATFDHPEVYSFVDISQNNHQKGQAHYDNAQKQRQRVAGRPRPLNNVKIYGEDGGQFGSRRDGIERFWRNIFGGLASARFHRPSSGIGLSEPAQRMLRSARAVTDTFDVFSCRPRNDLLGEREPNEAYCLAVPGKVYAVYFPGAGQVSLDVRNPADPHAVRWYDIDRGQWRPDEKPPAGSTLLLKTPGPGQWAAVVQ
ncbi:MAG: hypothetical protein JXB62_16145 [Pirellulales bacterium]|nr:hypothetical protein [Pirellulales bacterium]